MTSRLVSASLLVMFLASAATLRLRCPRRWNRFHSNCFLVVAEENTWSQAHEKCHQRNGHLAVLENLSENTFMASRAKDAFPNYHGKLLWIGLRAQDGSWEWPGNQSSTYRNWEGARAPDAHDTDCAVLVPRSNRWQANPCTDGSVAGFVCMGDAIGPQRTTPAPATTTTRPTTRPETTHKHTIVSEADHAKDGSKDIDRAQHSNADPDSSGEQTPSSSKPEMSLIVATAAATLVVVVLLVVILILIRKQHRPTGPAFTNNPIAWDQDHVTESQVRDWRAGLIRPPIPELGSFMKTSPGDAQAPLKYTTDQNTLYDDAWEVKEPCDKGALDEKRKNNAGHPEENIYTEMI